MTILRIIVHIIQFSWQKRGEGAFGFGVSCGVNNQNCVEFFIILHAKCRKTREKPEKT
jgi:hypothetical protein